MAYLTKQELYLKIGEIRNRWGQNPPLTLAGFLHLIHILEPELSVVRHAMDSRKFAGMLLRGEEGSVIVLNDARGALSQRFTLAHELIHYYLHPQKLHFLCDEAVRSPLEWQANEGAAELLLPYRAFLADVKNNSSLYHTDPRTFFQQMAQRYQVSTTVISNRLESLSHELGQMFQGCPIEEIVPVSARRREGFGLAGDNVLAGIDIAAD